MTTLRWAGCMRSRPRRIMSEMKTALRAAVALRATAHNASHHRSSHTNTTTRTKLSSTARQWQQEREHWRGKYVTGARGRVTATVRHISEGATQRGV
ncbi:unnamed protein product [Lota lota]